MNALVPVRSAIEGEVIAPGEGACTIVFQRSPFTSRTETVHVPPGTSIAEAIERVGIARRFLPRASAFIAEHRIEPDLWPKVRLKAGAVLYIRLTPGWNLIAAALQYAWAAIVDFVVTYGVDILVNVAITAAISYLYRQLNPPPEQNDQWSFDQQVGNPYGQITGLANREARYGPIPRVLGKRRLYPMVAARPYTEKEGNAQYLRMLLLVGYGPLKITDIRIGETPILSYAGASVQVREGWDTDLPQTLYTKLIDEDRFSITLNPSVYNTRTTALDTTEISLDITFPAGLAHFKDDGRVVNREVFFDVEYSSNGGSTWNPAVWIQGRSEDGTETNGVIRAKAASTHQFIRSGRFAVPSGQHQMRVRRTTTAGTTNQVDLAIWTVLRSIHPETDLVPPGCATISVRLKATEQLNGVPNAINCIAESYLETYNTGTGAWTWDINAASNPAWQYVNILRRRGLEIVRTNDRLDLDTFAEWAADCDTTAPNASEPRWRSHLVMEGGSVFSALKAIAAHGRAQFAIQDGKYSVSRDIPQTVPAQHITPRNSRNYRWSKTFVDVPHAWRATFINALKGYQPDEVIVYRDGHNADGSGGMIAATKFETLDFPGLTSDTNAWREGRYHLGVLLLRPEQHQVSMDFEHLRATKGDLVHFAHDAVSIGLAQGRISSVATDGVRVFGFMLDNPVSMESGKSYCIRVRRAEGQDVLHRVSEQVGIDIASIGIIELPLIADAPEIGDLYMFGELGLESMPCIISAIEPDEDLGARVTLLPASPDVHTADTGTIPAFNSFITSTTPIPQRQPPAPTFTLRSDEKVLQRLADGTLMERIEVQLDPIEPTDVSVSHWEVEYRTSDVGGTDGDYIFAARDRVAIDSLFIAPVLAGEIVDVRVRTISSYGVPSDWTEELEHTVIGKSTAPDAPTGFDVAAMAEGVSLTWTPSTALDVAGYEIRHGGANWDAATVLGVFLSPPVAVKFALSGAVTFRIKARDVVGLYSTEVTDASPAANSTAFVSGSLTVESAVVATDSLGNGGDFSAAGGTFKVWDGVIDKTGDGPTYSVQGTPSGGLSISINSTSGVYTITDMTGDNGQATLRAVYAGVTIDKVYSLAKSKQGVPGAAGSARSLMEMITDAGIATGLKVCLDAGEADSYSGTGQSWLDLSGNGYDFFRGTTNGSESTDPSFTGTPDSHAATAYFANDGGDRFTYDSAVETWMSNLHKDGAKFGCIIAVYIPAGFGSGGDETVRIIDTRGGGNNTGIMVIANRTVGVVPAGEFAFAFQAFNGSSNVNAGGSLPGDVGGWQIMAVAWDETNTTDGGRFALNGFANLLPGTGAYTGPSSGNASPMEFFRNARATTRLGAIAVWEGTIPTIAQLVSLSDDLNERYNAY